ncbi:MAG TPA: LON peptidase substrate-binding domain-containing protein, partial [Thermomicrobiales bacterium]|nr:LON peptidase substrate-binding domain-containing protein [Thermomicrobiales bacterium]
MTEEQKRYDDAGAADTEPREPAANDTNTSTAEPATTRQTLPVLPLRGTVVFPMTVVPLAAAQPRSLRLIDAVASGDRTVVLVLQNDAEQDAAGPGETRMIGTLSTIHQMMRVPDGTVRLAVQGVKRVRIVEWTGEEPYLTAVVEDLPEDDSDDIETQALKRSTVDLFQRLVSLVSNLPDELVTAALNVEEPLHLVYLIATNLRMDPDERQVLLEYDSVQDKLTHLSRYMAKELELLELGKKIQGDVQEEVQKTQRDYYLREQMKAIQRELGEGDGQEAEVQQLREQIEQAGMPEEAHREAERELDRLSKLPPAAAEYGVIKTYLDWLVSLPWNVSTETDIDIQKTREILDRDHYDMEKVKDRILEYLAVRKLRHDHAVDGDPIESREPIL